MTNQCYIMRNPDYKIMHDAITGWAERSFVIGGIAWHKQRDLEDRIDAFVRPYIERSVMHTDNSQKQVVKDLHKAWGILRRIADSKETDGVSVELSHLIQNANDLFNEYDKRNGTKIS